MPLNERVSSNRERGPGSMLIHIDVAHARIERHRRAPRHQIGPTGHIGVQALHSAVIQWKNVVFCTLQQEKLLQFIQLRRVLRGYVVRLRPVIRRIEFPHIVVDSAPTGTPPRTNLVFFIRVL